MFLSASHGEPGLRELDNVVLTPHLGSATIGTRTKMGMIAVDNLLAVCVGRQPAGVRQSMRVGRSGSFEFLVFNF